MGQGKPYAQHKPAGEVTRLGAIRSAVVGTVTRQGFTCAHRNRTPAPARLVSAMLLQRARDCQRMGLVKRNRPTPGAAANRTRITPGRHLLCSDSLAGKRVRSWKSAHSHNPVRLPVIRLAAANDLPSMSKMRTLAAGLRFQFQSGLYANQPTVRSLHDKVQRI